jgi:hypothetical protein
MLMLMEAPMIQSTAAIQRAEDWRIRIRATAEASSAPARK